MCGICGYFNIDRRHIGQDTLHDMTVTLQHRGPNNIGFHIGPTIGMGHTRLSIQDLSPLGNQPMRSEDNRYILIFNGEIYNCDELKVQLERVGYCFRSTSDTEVILKGFQHWGTEVFRKLNGIFAIGLWDDLSKKGYLVRDRFGVKPLYYSLGKEGVVFGSEIKAIMASNLVAAQLNYPAFHEYLYYGNALANETFYKNISKVEPGTFLIFSADNSIERSVYWSLEEIPAFVEEDESQVIINVREKLENAVRRQLISDVSLGVFLSGGIDSSAITAFASRHYGSKLKTFSAAFDFDNGVNELAKARRVANCFGTEHTEIFIQGATLIDTINALVYHHDEPFADAANIPLYLLCKSINGQPKVILQGDGGDEIFAGYRRYATLQHLKAWRLLHPLLSKSLKLLPNSVRKNQWARFASAMGDKEDAMVMALLMTVEAKNCSPTRVLGKHVRTRVEEVSPFAVYQQLDQNLSHLDIVQRMLWVDTKVILPNMFLEKVDKATMASGIEVRVPFLDYELTDYVMGLPSYIKVKNGVKKRILKMALRGIVPDDILDAPKTGFGVPYGNWIKGPLNDFFKDTVCGGTLAAIDFWDIDEIDKSLNDYQYKRYDHGFLLWKILQFSLWYESEKPSL